MEQTIHQHQHQRQQPPPQYTSPYRQIQPHPNFARNGQFEAVADPAVLYPNEFQVQLQRLKDAQQLNVAQQNYTDPHLFGDQDVQRNHYAPQSELSQPSAAPTTQHYGDYMGELAMHQTSTARLQQEGDPLLTSPDASDQRGFAHAPTRLEDDPPDLDEWRQRLFDVNDTITMSEEDYQTYFPHVDNVYSHRSTQKYKRKPFVSHYWDCRLKGRPPGTPKSVDPSKRKRKRTARERDLCDVKIKITEYFPGAMLRQDFVADTATGPDGNDTFSAQNGSLEPLQQRDFTGVINNATVVSSHPGANGSRFYTIQRVNGNGGNGKGDGIAGPHKHTLEESDKVKKNSVQRHVMKKEKDVKKSQKTYHKKATGAALTTVKSHSKNNELKLFGSCFCPFVQRVWIALEAKGIQYQYIEVDPYKKPKELLEVNPRGLVPGIRHGDWGCGESTVLMEYLEDLNQGSSLFPANDPKLKATCRLWTDHINRNIIPAFYKLLQAQEAEDQINAATKLREKIDTLIAASPSSEGPFFLGSQLSFVDVQFAPWMLRFKRVLKPYRAWPDPEEGSRWKAWLNAVENDECVKRTTSGDDLYVESYERYAENRPGTSELADAVNGGGGLP